MVQRRHRARQEHVSVKTKNKGVDVQRKAKHQKATMEASKSFKDIMQVRNEDEYQSFEIHGPRCRHRKKMEYELTIPKKVSLKKGKQAPNSKVPNNHKVKKIKFSLVPPDDVIFRRPRTNALFKAIRGQGNSLHGWYLNES